MENLNAVNDARQAVVEPVQGGNASKGGDGTGTPVSVTQTELTDRKQTAAENSGFRKIRLENEAYKKEIDRLRAQLGRATDIDK